MPGIPKRWANAYAISATPIASDLGAIGGGRRLAEEISNKGLPVDVVVNNAGYGRVGALNGSDAAAQLGMIDLNVRALVELTHIYWPTMMARKRGGVLNVASTAAFQPLMAVYYASKVFVLSFSEAPWEEAARRRGRRSRDAGEQLRPELWRDGVGLDQPRQETLAEEAHAVDWFETVPLGKGRNSCA